MNNAAPLALFLTGPFQPKCLCKKMEDVEDLLETALANGTVACDVEKIKVDLDYHQEGKMVFDVGFPFMH